MPEFPRQLCTTVSLLLCLPACLIAQPSSRDSIPRELAVAVLGIVATNPDSVLREGVAAANLPAGLIPPGAMVLGNMTFGRSASTVIRFPGLTRDMALDSLMRRLEALDWRPGPVPEMAVDMRGFHSNVGRGARPPIPSFFCKGTEIISLATSSPLSGVTLVIRHDQGRMADACNTRATSQVYAADIPYPSLSAHPDVQYTGGSHNSGRDDFFGSQRAVSSISPRALMNHYAPQLLAAGWVAQDSAFTSNLAVRSFVLSSRPALGPGAAGRMTGDWILVLSITRPDGGLVTDLRFWGNRK